MEALITSFGLDYEEFRDQVRSRRGVIAGSSVVAEFLREAGQDPGFVPGDIDVWFIHRGTRRGEYFEGLRNLLTNCNYKISYEKSAHYSYISLDGISIVDEYVNPDGKKIQIIAVFPFESTCLAEYIRDNYDLSCCMAYWKPQSEKITHMFPEATLERRMILMNGKSGPKVEARIEKYKGRGFTLVPSFDKPPSFDKTSPWNKVDCTDILTFDECTVASYLSILGNIVIKSGNQHYGFSRDMFILSTTPYKGAYKTPIGHIISVSELQKVRNQRAYIFEAFPLNGLIPYTNTLKVLLGTEHEISIPKPVLMYPF